MRIVFIGVVDFSYHCLEQLLKDKAEVVAVLSKKTSAAHADFKSLWPLAEKHKIPIFNVKDINAKRSEQIIKKFAPDVIFCFGWSQLLKPNILNIPPKGVIGVHPAMLPANRGRHPIIWALTLGLKKSALTFFQMTPRADDGDIVFQKEFAITYQDTAATVYLKIKNIASKHLKDVCQHVQNRTPAIYDPGRVEKNGKKIEKNQKNEKIASRNKKIEKNNYWRKRGLDDGFIDWRMSSRAIYNLVRALTVPYVGAHCQYNQREVKVWKVSEKSSELENIEPGKVLNVRGRRILVKTFDGAVELEQHDFDQLPKKGDYLQ